MSSDRPDPEQILAALGVSAASQPTPVTGGLDAAIWRFDTDQGQRYALRVFPAGREARFRRELAAMEAAAASGLRVPGIRAAGPVDSHLAMVMDWCEGQTMLAAVSSRPWKLWTYGRLLGQEQARLQAIAAPPELADGAPEYWLGRSGQDDPLARALLDRGLRCDRLVHMDFHPLNVLVDRTDRISGIVDWAGAAAGDPRADFAMTSSILSVAPVPPGPLRPILRRFRRLLYGAWRGAYEKKAGPVDDQEVAPFLAWAGTAMLRDMEPRAREGGAWPTMEDLEPIRGWVQHWTARAGLD